MSKVRFGVIVFPGSNCDRDCYYVLKDLLQVRVNYIWHQEEKPKGFDCLILPGGFSYGDYLRCGAIARFSPVMEFVQDFARQGGLVLGICNGFQILLECGLLPGAMLRNEGLKFICQFIYVRVDNTQTPFTGAARPGQVLKLPVKHNEGNYYVEEETLKEMKRRGQIVLRYSTKEGVVTMEANPNGALDNIAGICNERKNVFGLMPHPENSSEPILSSQDGLVIFKSVLQYIEDGEFRYGEGEEFQYEEGQKEDLDA